MLLVNKKDFDKKVKIDENIFDDSKNVHQIKNISTKTKKTEKAEYPDTLIYLLVVIIIVTIVSINTYEKYLIIGIIGIILFIYFVVASIYFYLNMSTSFLTITMNSGKEFSIKSKNEKIISYISSFLDEKINQKSKSKLEINLFTGEYKIEDFNENDVKKGNVL